MEIKLNRPLSTSIVWDVEKHRKLYEVDQKMLPQECVPNA